MPSTKMKKRKRNKSRYERLPRGANGQGLATIASDHHKRMVDKHRVKLQEIEQGRLKDLKDLAKVIGKQSITIEANANDEGHLYGSVTAAEIVDALKQNDITLTNDQIRLEGVLKELGLYTVKVHLHRRLNRPAKTTLDMIKAGRYDRLFLLEDLSTEQADNFG